MLTCRGARFDLSPVSGSCCGFFSYSPPPPPQLLWNPSSHSGRSSPAVFFAYPSNPRIWGENFWSLVPEQCKKDGEAAGLGGRCPGRDPPAAGGAAGADFSLFLRRGGDSGRCFFLGAQPLDLMPFGAWLALEESGQTVSPVIPSSPVLPTGAKSWLTTVISE